ncbi:hypothetical protein [Flavobacterium sp.]|uniref:hypothetical protein n=1 Tax=Flavobacterium sp. TaxID=239 RepID=UPI003D0D5B7E
MKYYQSVEKNIKLVEERKVDQATYSNELREILNRYDDELEKNGILLESIPVTKNSQKRIEKPKEIGGIKSQIVYRSMKKDLVKIDSLVALLKNAVVDKNDLLEEIKVLRDRNKELNRKNYDNESIIAISKNLTATNITADGVKIVGNNILEAKRLNALEQLKVCFTLLENRAAIKGNKDLYIQIVNPAGEVVSKTADVFETKESLLRYSAKTNVYYDNEELDVCVFVDPNKVVMTKGDYELNIYSGINLIGNSVFTLK